MKYGGNHPGSAFEGKYNTEYGIRVDTDEHIYLLRCDAFRMNFYCSCYEGKRLDEHIRRAERGIRFVDYDGEDLFRIPAVKTAGKVKMAETARRLEAARRVKILRIAETSRAAETARIAEAVRTAKAVRTAETARMAETVRSLPRRREEIRGRLKKRGPAKVRVNAVLSSTEAFYKVYPDLKEGDGMYVAPEKWVKIW